MKDHIGPWKPLEKRPVVEGEEMYPETSYDKYLVDNCEGCNRGESEEKGNETLERRKTSQ